MISRTRVEVIAALVLCVFCGIGWQQALLIRHPRLVEVSPGLFPMVCLAFVSICSVAYLIQAFSGTVRSEAEEGERGALWLLNPAICIVLFTGFILALPYLGILISGTAFMVLLFSFTGRRDAKGLITNFLVAFGCSATMWASMRWIFRVYIPSGSLTGF
ncbi:tripartite tricarboxylate transporter TctB family protein [Pelagibacterium lacus]|uniref:Tripartite tricarboxylate transporter TctB family protein n=1 Tax=Pelagibacterium lacus TaxID=2282655 RepID=A0A369W0J1_9HYPH|nr:tripartite tricarboxylate transporter TctB family protein [Pelagibacterium lacus]RDE07893.1 tripartite tricarboxylate transporter TctB family protein [Pelagibacterium lacus]